jgi:hypothetical protein
LREKWLPLGTKLGEARGPGAKPVEHIFIVCGVQGRSPAVKSKKTVILTVAVVSGCSRLLQRN